jgi:hypothetical protein
MQTLNIVLVVTGILISVMAASTYRRHGGERRTA